MNETEIVGQLAVHGDRIWSVLQYWTSVSFGIMVAGHFAADRIHWSVLALFGLLYIAFSNVCLDMLNFDSSTIRAGLDQLQSMADNGAALGRIGQNFVENSPLSNQTLLSQFFWILTGFGLFLTTLAYPAYCHFKSKKSLTD